MKKNISINISGINFHIEEDGFIRLEQYLKSINQYFSTFEDREEIINDIENRIAEIFMSKMTTGNQTITLLDIESLVNTMGTVTDFQASLEDSTDGENPKESNQQDPIDSPQSDPETGKRRLYRNTKHRVLGGVASGLANYFKIDPIWIRLLILGFFFNVLFWGLTSTTFVAYIILWIILPEDPFEEEKNIRKLYRNNENRVIGGVSSGIAAYFGIDTTVIRLLFIISIFLGGSGVILYFLLWIIIPEAHSITEKMQMQGEPVTLSNIESNLKKKLNIKTEDENVFIKIILIPFRIVALALETVAKLLGPLFKFLVEAIRIFIGLVITGTGLSLSILVFSLLFFFIGIHTSWTDLPFFDAFPTELISDSINGWAIASFFMVLIIPALLFIFLGITMILKRSIINAYIGWGFFGLWILAIIGISAFVPNAILNFLSENSIRKERIFQPTLGIPTLKLRDDHPFGNKVNINFDRVSLRLLGHQDSSYLLVTKIESRGKNREDARKSADAVSYQVTQTDDDFIFDTDLQFEKASFRFQEAQVTLYVPYDQIFRMEATLADILSNTLSPYGYRSSQMEGNDWVFDTQGLHCITCPDTSDPTNEDDSTLPNQETVNLHHTKDWEDLKDDPLIYKFEDFSDIEISGHLKVIIEASNHYYVGLKGENTDEVFLKMQGKKLKISTDSEDSWSGLLDGTEPISYLLIQTPSLENIEFSGGVIGEVAGFKGDKLEISLNGASEIDADLAFEFLEIYLVGASHLKLTGSGKELESKVVGASKLSALNYHAARTMVTANGASTAYVYGSDKIEIKASGVSKVFYEGTNNTTIDNNGLSTVKKR